MHEDGYWLAKAERDYQKLQNKWYQVLWRNCLGSWQLKYWFVGSVVMGCLLWYRYPAADKVNVMQISLWLGYGIGRWVEAKPPEQK